MRVPQSSEDPNRLGPTILATMLVVAILIATVSLGVALKKRSPTERVSSTAATSTEPAFDFAAAAPEGFEPRDPVAPQPMPGTVHQVRFEVREEQVEIAPGVSQLMWTFNGEVPGPILRGKIGDTFEITLVNKGTMGHSIDFHASKVAWDDEMRTIAPGESLVYRFVAQHAGIFMYHCGTAPVVHHIAMGMYGAIIVDSPELAPVDHEYVFVQSELYKDPKPTAPLDLAPLLAEQWDAVVFNGYVNQYRDHPIKVQPGERIRVWVQDDGPSENSSFHVVGTIFDTVFKEGTYLLRPDARQGGSQALDLQPAQGGFVEFTLDEHGLYPFVTHKFASASKGALGFFQAGAARGATGGH
jgi:nitrite reductase (NO-forming)